MRAFFVVNPHSAGGKTGKLWPAIKELAERELGPLGVGMTERPRHAVEIARRALHDGWDMVVSLGGDGTNNEVVNGFFEKEELINPDAAFAVVCSGTGSDLIRTAKIPRDFRESVPLLASLEPKPTDVGRMTLIGHDEKQVCRHFINIASFGVGGEVDDRVNRTTKAFGGRVSFLVGSLRGTLAYTNSRVKITMDDREPIERTVFNVVVANGQYFGAGMRTAPGAELDDGLFDVVVMGDFSFREQLKLTRTIYSGEHLAMAKVESFRARKVTAETEERVLIDMDGEQPGRIPSTFEVLPGVIKMARP